MPKCGHNPLRPKRYSKRWGTWNKAWLYGLEAYIEAKVLVEGLRRASGSSNSAALMKELESMRDWDGGGYFVTYQPANHQGGSFVEIGVIDSAGSVRR